MKQKDQEIKQGERKLSDRENRVKKSNIYLMKTLIVETETIDVSR